MRVTLPSGTDAEISRAEGADRGLVIAPDIWGLRQLFDEMVARFATAWGLTTIAVEPFPGQDLPSDDLAVRQAAVSRLRDDDVLRDLTDAADLTGVEPVGLIGFCMGGMYCFTAAQSPRFDRIASFYGMIRLPDAWRTDGHREPLEILAEHDATHLLAIVGGLDPYTPPDDVAALDATGATVMRYADADHGFAHAPDRPSHRVDDAADAFDRARSWLTG